MDAKYIFEANTTSFQTHPSWLNSVGKWWICTSLNDIIDNKTYHLCSTFPIFYLEIKHKTFRIDLFMARFFSDWVRLKACSVGFKSLFNGHVYIWKAKVRKGWFYRNVRKIIPKWDQFPMVVNATVLSGFVALEPVIQWHQNSILYFHL